jgi:hypothetical protein
MKNCSLVSVPSVSEEFSRLEVKDARLRRRAIAVVERLSAAPDLSFPRALETVAEREAFYRLLANPRITYVRLVRSHAEQAVARMGDGEKVIAIHDTTELTFNVSGELRDGLGRGRSEQSKQGFFAHVSMAVALDGKPLGSLAMSCWAREQRRKGKRKLSGAELAGVQNKESARWGLQVKEVEGLVADRAKLIHVMDREADAYPLLCGMAEHDRSFVVRVARERLVFGLEPDGALSDEPMPLSEFLVDLPTVLTREVPLGRRRPTEKTLPKTNKTHPERAARTAKLAICAGRLAFRRPRYLGDEFHEELELNVVQVREVDTPESADPVAWVLVTNEPVETPEQIEKVVDYYRQRWLIEEFFKAIKTGCDFESRQLESFDTLTNALGLFLPVAWQMLLLRWMSRTNPSAPAETVLSPVQMILLRNCGQKLPKSGATALDALYAVAGLGGHIKNNGAPGWLTLARGLEDLTKLERGWRIASAQISPTSCDQ